MDLVETGILDLQNKMSIGELSAKSLVEHYQTRIETLDQQGPVLSAVISHNPECLKIAEALDEERAKQGSRGPLHGIPVLLKDNIATADQMPCTAGSIALSKAISQQDARLVEKLRAAGAVILGKTNLSEWANFRSSRSSSGWSSLGGQTKNPYVLDRNPCGSSSGSAVAVAANLCSVAIGTETDGSIVCPAAINGIVGIKPSLGLISAEGIIPIAHSQDTAGPMARTVEDAAILLSLIADKAFPLVLDAGSLKGTRLGLARNFFGFHEEADALIDAAVAQLKDLGAEIVETRLETKDELAESEYEVLLYEFKHGLNAYLQGLGPEVAVHSLEELIAFNEDQKHRLMPYFGQEHLLKAQEKGSLSDKAYLKALEKSKRLSRQEGIDACLNRDQLDAIIAPTTGPAWTTDLLNGDNYLGSCSSPAAVAGYPHVTVPAGFIHGLPIGLSFFGAAFQDLKLINYAYAYEQASKQRKPPKFLPSLAL